MLDLTGFRGGGGNHHYKVLNYSLPKINEEVLGNLTELTTRVIDLQSSPSIIPIILRQINTTVPFSVYIGPMTSTTTLALLNNIHNHLVIAFSATSAIIRGDNFVRVIPSDGIQIKTLARFIQKIGCSRIGIIRATDSYGLDFSSGLSKECNSMNINISVTITLEPTEYGITIHEIVKLKSLPVIVVVVSYPLTKTIIEYAEMYGMTGDDYVWIFSEGAVSQIPQFLNDALKVTHWFASVALSGPIPDNIDKSLISPAVNIFSVYVHDSILVLASALRNLIRKQLFNEFTNTSILRQEILSLNITGLSGRILFDKNGEREAQYLIINGLNGDQYSSVAIYDSISGAFNLTAPVASCRLQSDSYFTCDERALDSALIPCWVLFLFRILGVGFIVICVAFCLVCAYCIRFFPQKKRFRLHVE